MKRAAIKKTWERDPGGRLSKLLDWVEEELARISAPR
jgi:hypothetical protein